MGDMREYFDAMKEHSNRKRQERNEKYKPLLIKLGAVQKSGSVYEYDNWFLYPTKGFAMYKYNNSERVSLEVFLKEHKVM